MNLIQAMKRLSYTIGNGHKANDKDVDALNAVIEWVNAEKENRVNENRYFGKLVGSYYVELLPYYNFDNALTEKAIQEILEQPLENWYFKIKQRMNLKSWLEAAEMLDLNVEYVYTGKDEKERKGIAEKNKYIMRENKDLLLKAVDPWTDKEINSKMNYFISELLNKYGNLP